MASSDRRLAVVDQALSSLTNFMASLYAARALDIQEFGLFAILSVVYLFAMGITRAAFSEVAIVNQFGNAPGWDYARRAVDATLVASAVLAVSGVLVVRLLLGVDGTQATLVFVAIAVMTWQDSIRVVSIGIGRAIYAVLNDGLWFAFLVVALVYLEVTRPATPWAVMAAWGLSAIPGACLGLLLLRWRPSPRPSLGFFRLKIRLSIAFLTDWLMKSGSGQLATYGVGLVGGLPAVAGIRTGLLILGPLNVLYTGLQLAAIPHAVKLKEICVSDMARSLNRLSLLLGVSALLTGVAARGVPTGWLEVLLGEQAPLAQVYVLPLSVALASTGFAVGGHVGLRVLQSGGELVKTRSISTVLYLASGGLALAAIGNALGGLWGLAVGGLMGSALWARALRRATHSARVHDLAVLGVAPPEGHDPHLVSS